jgi:CRP-like cAMP-binding protein
MPPLDLPNPRQNRLLADLPPEEYERLAHDLEAVALPMGQVLCESGEEMRHAYFPVDCILSRVHTTCAGQSIELAMTGRDGLVGISLLLGGDVAMHRIEVQSAGTAYRLRSEVLSWEFAQGAGLHRLVLCYTQALLTQVARAVVCIRHHAVDQQLARWMLHHLDLRCGDTLDMTHEHIGHLLGVRREGVTEAAGKLQAAGLIRYHRGHIAVTDRKGLEARACECYQAVREELQRLCHGMKPGPQPRQRARANPATLRNRAEARLREVSGSMPDTPWDAERLLHELQVHQIELEMHNEELQHAYDEADRLRERYADIYDFAPLAYFTLDVHGVIVQTNLAGAILLGIKRSECGRYRFAASVAQDSLAEFSRFHQQVLQSRSRVGCQVVLRATGQRDAIQVWIEAVTDESGSECRMVVIDPDARGNAIRL